MIHKTILGQLHVHFSPSLCINFQEGTFFLHKYFKLIKDLFSNAHFHLEWESTHSTKIMSCSDNVG